MKKYILALDQGTTSSRAIIFDHNGEPVAAAQKEFSQIYPKPGWVEHDANEIWSTQAGVALEAIVRAGIDSSNLAAVGCFIVMNTGNKPIESKNNLLTTIAWKIGEEVQYALEGSIFIGGDQMPLILPALPLTALPIKPLRFFSPCRPIQGLSSWSCG